MTFNESLTLAEGSVGLYAQGDSSKQVAAVIVLQEIFGVNANIRSTVDRLAQHGYRAVAPDLFWRQRPGVDLDPANADDRAAGMSMAQAYRESAELGMADLATLVGELRKNHRLVGVVGYCLGGRVAFQSWLSLDVDMVVSYYGVGIDSLLDSSASPRAPMLMHLGAEDPLNPPSVQNAIIEGLAGQTNVTVEIYGGVGHAFARLGGASYVAEAAVRADAATFAFLAKHLV